MENLTQTLGRLYLLFIVALTIAGCGSTWESFSPLVQVNGTYYDDTFAQYVQLDSTRSFEMNATLCSFIGDYPAAIAYASKRVSDRKSNPPIPELTHEQKEELEQLVQDMLSDPSQRAVAKSILDLSNQDVPGAFAAQKPMDALSFIVSESAKYHFLLLNEAHYNSQNRAFTHRLLKPLWDNGYRYLALEALGYTDSTLMARGYPRRSTGFYFKDSVFGALITEALSLGYILVPYEAQNNLDNASERDREQAQNIYDKTLRKDAIGKVIVHAGYSHIFERGGSEYNPMGYDLGVLTGRSILSIDQQSMTELNDDKLLNAHYRFALDEFKFTEPTVFVNSEGTPFVEPLNAPGIDVQVFHPRTTYKLGRPIWLQRPGYYPYELPPAFAQYGGCLVQAVSEPNDPQSVPDDQFIIGKAQALVLKPGDYLIRIINRKGFLVATCKLSASRK